MNEERYLHDVSNYIVVVKGAGKRIQKAIDLGSFEDEALLKLKDDITKLIIYAQKIEDHTAERKRKLGS